MPLVLAAPAKVPSLPANVTLMPPGGVWFGPVSSGAHMTDERQAIERLERRLEHLEAIVRKVLSRGDLPLEDPGSPAEPLASSWRREPRTAARAEVTPAAPVEPDADGSGTRDLEQWVGQRGLLVVGVVALVAAGGFFLKYAFDRGWISPWFRVVGAAVAGIGLGVWGDRLIAQGLRRYGAGIIAAGAGLVYLGIWAAGGPYALVGRQLGLALLTGVTVAVAVLAVRHRVEELAILATVGAYLAPIVLPDRGAQPALLLGYLEVVGLGSGVLAHQMSWRRCFNVALLGYFGRGMFLAWGILGEPVGLWFVAAGGIAALVATAGPRWLEARAFGLAAAWLSLLLHNAPVQSTGTRSLALAVAVALAGVVWWQHRAVTALHSPAIDALPEGVESVIFLASPLAFALVSPIHFPGALRSWPALAPAIAAVAYAATGWPRRSVPHVALAFALLALAAAVQWHGLVIVLAWTGLVLGAVAVAVDRRLGQPGGLVVAPWLAALAFVQLFWFSSGYRTQQGAFVDDWALVLYSYVSATAFSARLWRRPVPALGGTEHAHTVLWVLTGAAILGGGSIELQRFFAARAPTWEAAGLAGDLALSAYWLLYAAALVRTGFWLEQKPVRSAGLGVAGLAILKIALYDLSNLEALYRVGSFFVLALITLAVAYAYNRRAQALSRR